MNVRRGDVVLVQYPFASGAGSSRRPALVVQNDHDNERLHNTIVAQITTNLSRASDSRHLLIDLSTAEGRQSGLLHDSVVSCTNLATVHEDRVGRVIGHLSASALQPPRRLSQSGIRLTLRRPAMPHRAMNGVAVGS